MEIVAHAFLFGFTLESYILNLLISSLIAGGLISLISGLFKGKARKVVTAILLFIAALLFCLMLVYYHIFQSFFMWNTLGFAGDVMSFYREAFVGIKECWLQILLMFLPFILYVIFFRKIDPNMNKKTILISLLVTLLAIEGMIFNLSLEKNKTYWVDMHYDATSTYYQYGINAGSAIDIIQTIFGEPEREADTGIDVNTLGKTDVRVVEERVIEKNVVDMDADALLAAAPNSTIKEMHQYFLSKPATSKNDYTGLFEGKNLIYFCLEGFSYKAISEKYTPTLYMMYNTGFHFTNFYDPLWGGSTATGEYANMTGNFYSSASCLPKSAGKNNYSAIGNLFKRNGYNTFAYHDGEYNYYDRNLSHPSFGYNSWKAIGNGLQLSAYSWPNSDLLMAEATINDYINSDKPFHTYYMTISGHTNYTFKGNMMASKHKKDTDDMNASDLVRGYVGTQMEVDLMCQYLIEELEKAGKLDDTVFALCCDHYPYGLKDEPLAELYGLPEQDIRGNFELYHNAFILWCSSMESPVVIDTPCCSIDMVPTIANLFNMEYDSRFYAGTDILSPEENIAIINTLNSKGGSWNWKTTQGTYYTVSKKFVKSDTCTLRDDEIDNYVKSINARVTNMRKYSPMVLDYNYYNYVFNTDGSPKYPGE